MNQRWPFVLFWFFLTTLTAVAQNDTVVFSAQGGFYNEVFSLELYNVQSQNHIRYTVNGNRPTAQSPLYEGPLQMDGGMYSKSDIFTILNCPEQEFFQPDSVRHCIVIRAAAFDANDNCVSEVMTNSFFIGALGCDTHGLPVVSICADSLDLFGFEDGIFVPGMHYDPLNPYLTGNYFMKGREWERLCNLEFYELDNSGVNQQVGLRTHGKKARWQGQKGMKVYAREEYGNNRLNHRFFEDLSISSFKHLCLKPFMSAWNGSGCKDDLANRVARQLDVEALASRACVLFLNGEYWGVYYLAERPDERFLEDHYDVDIHAVNIIDIWNDIDCGNGDNFYALRTWMEQADLSDEEQYAYAATHIDIANFIDYYAFELFSANLDWPASNIKMWQEGDGPWRWIFYDGDACFEQLDFDAFANATYDGDAWYPASRQSTLFFRKLLENKGFREQFVTRLNQLVSGSFAYRNTRPYFEAIRQRLQAEVPRQAERFNIPVSYEEWEKYCMTAIDRFLSARPHDIIQRLNEFLPTDEAEVGDVQCYPNPFTDEIHLDLMAEDFGSKVIGIYDLTGRTMYSTACLLTAGPNEIILHPNLPTGVFVLKVGRQTLKIIRI